MNTLERKAARFRAAALSLCCIGLLALLAASPMRATAARRSSSSSATKKLAEKAKQMKDLKSKLSATKAMERDVLDDLDSLDQNLDGANRKLDETLLDLQRTRAHEERMRDQLDAAQDDYDEYNQAVGGRLTSFYMNGRGRYFEALLGSNSLTDFIGRIHYMRTLMENDRAMVMNLRRLRDSLKDYHGKLEAAGKRIELLAGKIRAQQEAIEQERFIRKGTLDKILNQKKYYVESLERMEQESEEISRMIRSRQRGGGGGGYVPGAFSGRMAYPARGGIISEYGYRVHPRYGVRKMHLGIDISCRTGTPVIASESGVVLLAGWKRGYGQTVIIMHAGNVSTLYGHGSRILVSQGETVKRGDVIMYSGATGNATGPHLHYEVRVNGDPVNPIPYF